MYKNDSFFVKIGNQKSKAFSKWDNYTKSIITRFITGWLIKSGKKNMKVNSRQSVMC